MRTDEHTGDLPSGPSSEQDDPNLAHLRHIIAHAAHLLPAQGPIPVFIHHNTLHALEHNSFDQAVRDGARIFRCQTYLPEDRYRHELARGRIRFGELQEVLREDLKSHASDIIFRTTTLLDVRLAMLEFPLRIGPQAELLWYMAESDALRKVRSAASMAHRAQLISETRQWAMRDLRPQTDPTSGKPARPTRFAHWFRMFGESYVEHWTESTWEAFALEVLWEICRDGTKVVPLPPAPPLPIRHRDLLLEATSVDSDLAVHELLIRVCAGFVDQGFASWEFPRRQEGFWIAFETLYGKPGTASAPCFAPLAKELARLRERGVTPLASIRESLELLGVAPEEWQHYLSETFLALRGWGGIIRFLEERPDRAVRPIPPGSLTQFLAIRLILDRLSLDACAKQSLNYRGSLADLRTHLRQRIGPPTPPTTEQRAFLVFQLSQLLGWSPRDLFLATPADWTRILTTLEGFDDMERRRVFHLAYERRFYSQTLDAITLHSRTPQLLPENPRFQAIFCIDEREESIRRHVEEVIPNCVTYGIAGFFAVAMYYRGAADAHYVPLCPAVMLPQHWVTEQVGDEHEETHQKRSKTRRFLGIASHQFHLGSRTFALGALFSAAVGVLASIPLVARTLFPRMTARIRRMLGRFVAAPPITHLKIERSDTKAGAEGSAIGYSLQEMCNIAERVLRDTGLTRGFARLVFTFGHGSTSMNNPHESAHDCGACGGARGGPNGRAIAHICNDPRVRDYLRTKGIDIPTETVFVGGMHNTSSEELLFFDLHRLPETHREEFNAIRVLLEEACDRDAHERARRFESAPLTLSFTGARQHMEGRAEDLAQVRPEWGHATNAICIVARRKRTRGLFLDRRSFLNSYDPTQDDADSTILVRLLQAAVPVCGGINLEYYFSYVDNPGFGCGTKLPHNITSLVGVMDGAASDLRTGLPWQMVEIHEPVRLLFVIETTPEKMQSVMDRFPTIGGPIRNGWVKLSLLDPDSPTMCFFENGSFQRFEPTVDRLPQAPTSMDWYRGWRDHLEFAQIGRTDLGEDV